MFLPKQVKNDSIVATRQNIPEIFSRKEEFHNLCNKIDRLESFVTLVNGNLATLEQHVSTAEAQLGVNALGLKGLLKPIFDGIAKKRTDNNSIAPDAQTIIYEAPEIFRTENYFSGNLCDVNAED